MNRWKTALLLPLALMLGGCVTYPTYTYRDGMPVRDVHYASDDSDYRPATGGYGDYYSGGYRYGSAGYRYYAPDYISYSAYYSLFWPIHRWYHDPYWYPDFFYGVTYFPRNYFSVSFHSGWRGHSYSRWGYGGSYSIAFGYSHWYSPYRYSWADSYYDWDRYRYRVPAHEHARGHGYAQPYYAQPRFGHARNQAERLAWRERERRAPSGDGIATGMGMRAPSVYGNARVPSRSADYGRPSEGQWRTAEPRAPQGAVGVTARPAAVERERYARGLGGSAPRAPENGGRRYSGPAREVEGLALPETSTRSPSRAPRLSAPVRSYPTEEPSREMYRSREMDTQQGYRRGSYSESSPQPRVIRSEPPRAYAPEQREAPASPRVEFGGGRSGRGADFGGGRDFSAPEPSPRRESAREDLFRSAPVESRRESSPSPRAFEERGGEARSERASRSREALPFD